MSTGDTWIITGDKDLVKRRRQSRLWERVKRWDTFKIWSQSLIVKEDFLNRNKDSLNILRLPEVGANFRGEVGRCLIQ